MNPEQTSHPRDRSILEMDPEEMRKLGYHVIDRVVEHLAGMEQDPVWRMWTRQEGENQLREPVPSTGAPVEELIATLETTALAHAGRIGHPRFFAFVPSAITFPGLMGELLSDAYNLFVGTWVGGSGPTMLELVVVDWIREMLGLPEGSGGLLTTGGSEATLIAMVVARNARLDNQTQGAVIYASDQTHSSTQRAAWIAGFPRDAVRHLPTVGNHALDPDVLRAAIQEDRQAGRVPFLLVGNAGTTNTGTSDPLDALAKVCQEEGLWFHIDAAYGGFAAITTRGRDALKGLAEADSWVLDPHKWLYQGYECGSLLVRRPEELQEAFNLTADYLQDAKLGDERPNFGDGGVQLSRSARSVKVWLSLKTFGLGPFRKAVDRVLDLASDADRWIREAPDLELLSPAQLGVVCFRYRAAGTGEERDSLNRAIMDRLNAGGYAFLSSTRIGGRFSLRLCILSHRTTAADVSETIRRIRSIGEALSSGH